VTSAPAEAGEAEKRFFKVAVPRARKNSDQTRGGLFFLRERKRMRLNGEKGEGPVAHTTERII